MIYSTQNCPHCKAMLGRKTNPSTTIGNPFSKCYKCGNIIIDNYTREWITIPPHKRALMKGGRIFNRQELIDDINLSLRSTETIEYVEQLQKAGFKIYPIEGYQPASKHDDAVAYSLTNYFVPSLDGPNICKQDLVKIKDFEFTRNEFSAQLSYIKTIDPSVFEYPFSHNDRVYQAYRAFKPSLLNALFPGGITYADSIIQSFAKILSINLDKCFCDTYFSILIMYFELMRDLQFGYDESKIVQHIVEKFPNMTLSSKNVVLSLLSLLHNYESFSSEN